MSGSPPMSRCTVSASDQGMGTFAVDDNHPVAIPGRSPEASLDKHQPDSPGNPREPEPQSRMVLFETETRTEFAPEVWNDDVQKALLRESLMVSNHPSRRYT